MAEPNATGPLPVEARVNNLEKWQGVVDYRLDDGSRRFDAMERQMVAYGVKQNELEMHILNGNRDTAELKHSFNTWVAEEKERRNTAKTNKPKWWQVGIGIAAAAASVGSLTVAIIVLANKG